MWGRSCAPAQPGGATACCWPRQSFSWPAVRVWRKRLGAASGQAGYASRPGQPQLPEHTLLCPWHLSPPWRKVQDWGALT